jgi:hypothetical protein
VIILRRINFDKMKKIIFILLIANSSLLITNAQTQFQRAIGGSSDERSYCIVQTTDGGYAISGFTSSFGAGFYDMYILKIDSSGTLQWSKTVGGGGDDEAESIIQTSDDGYAVAGYTKSFGEGNEDMYVVKLDAAGTLQWSRTVGGGGIDFANSIIQTSDGGYAVAGYTSYSFGVGNYDIYIVKLNSSGTLQWSRVVGGAGDDLAFSIIQTTDGGYAVVGQTFSFGAGQSDMYVVKLDAGGIIQWSRTVGGGGTDWGLSIIQTTDGGYAVAGETYSFGAGFFDMYIAKFTVNGTLQWLRIVGGTASDGAESIIQTIEGGYAAVGYSGSFGAGFNDMYIVKLDVGGAVQWSRTVGGTGYDGAFSFIRTIDGGYAAAGWTKSFGAVGYDMYIVKFESNWNTCSNMTFPTSSLGTSGTTTSPTSAVNSVTSTVTTPMPTTNTGGTVTTICFMAIQPVSNQIPSLFELFQNFPNPFNPTTKIRFTIPVVGAQYIEPIQLKVYDALGREVQTLVNESLQPGTYEVDFPAPTGDGSNFSSGVYYYTLAAESFTQTKRMVLVK